MFFERLSVSAREFNIWAGKTWKQNIIPQLEISKHLLFPFDNDSKGISPDSRDSNVAKCFQCFQGRKA